MNGILKMPWSAYWARWAIVGNCNVSMLLIKRGLIFSPQDIGPWISVMCIPQIFRALYLAETTFTTWHPTWLAASFLQHIRNIGSLVYSVGSYPVMRGCGNLMMDSHSQGHERKVLFTLLVEWWNHDSLSLHTQNLHSAHKFDCLWFSPPKSKDVKHRES